MKQFILCLLTLYSFNISTEEITYCPRNDVEKNIKVSIEVRKCQSQLINLATINEIENCFAPKTLRWYISQLRLMGISKKCMNAIKANFVVYKPTCTNPYCGRYTDFSRYLYKHKGIEESRFTHEDAVKLIETL